MVILIGSACSGGKCNENTPITRPSIDKATERALTIDQYVALVYGPGPSASFSPTTVAEHELITKLVPKLLEGASAAKPSDPTSWQADAAAAGFRIEVWKVKGQTYWGLIEAPDKPRGAGAYIFRVAPREADPTLLLEAPHNFYDVGTGKLAAELFFDSPPGVRPRALFTNTIHRYQLAPGDKKQRKHNPADVAHNPEHAFSIATMAFAAAAGGARVIQLHGFGSRSDDDDDSETGAIAMVVSAGDPERSSPLTTALASALAGVLGNEVKRFPEDTKTLGATTNAQGRLLRGVDHSEFVHLEMSSELRKRLADDPALRQRLGSILFNTTADRK